MRDAAPSPTDYDVRLRAHGEEVDVKAKVIRGRLVWGMDILAGKPPAARGLVTVDTDKLWPGGVVPIDDSAIVGMGNFANIWADATTGLNGWTTRAGIRFVRRTTQSNYLVIRPADDNNICGKSFIGMQGGAQELLLDPFCTADAALHEIGHALGLFHEHQRSDRAAYINVIKSNVDTQACPDFDTDYAIVTLSALISGPYDVASIMHYPSGACAKNPSSPVLLSKTIGTINNPTILTDGDVCSVLQYYNPVEFKKRGCFENTTDCHRSQNGLTWSCDGPIPGKTCLAIKGSADTTTNAKGVRVWSDNYICGEPVARMTYTDSGQTAAKPPKGCSWSCVTLNEGDESDAHRWKDARICSDRCSQGLSSCYTFEFSSHGPIADRACLQLFEPEDPDGWGDNYLCFPKACGASAPP